MNRFTQSCLKKHSNEKKTVIIPSKKGLIKLEVDNGVIIVYTENEGLFNGRRVITLTEQSEVLLSDKTVVLPKGEKGWFFNRKVFFHVGLKYIGLGEEHIKGKTNNIVALC